MSNDRLSESENSRNALISRALIGEETINNIRIALEPTPVDTTTDQPVELAGKQRLTALNDLDVLDTPSPRSLQVLVELANRFIGTPVSLISIVTDDRQFFLSSAGLPEPWSVCRETPLSHSFCQYVVKQNKPLVIPDSCNHPVLKHNLAVGDLAVKSYLGVPIVMPDGNVLGSFCAIDSKPRDWNNGDLETLRKLAEIAVVEMEVRRDSKQKQKILENRLVQAQKMQAIGQLVGGVAHDFNNVLGAIQIQTELLEAHVGEQATSSVKNIHSAVRSAKSMVQQLLNWSRPSVDKKVAISLSKIVSDSLPLIETYSTKFIEVEFDPKACSDTVQADPNKISQVLLNLCSNAAYALKSVGGKITIKIDKVELDNTSAETHDLEQGAFVKLSVHDNGCGIPASLQQRIHDPYFTTKPVGEGTGLGLWTVFGIVQELSGSVHVESVENEGTTIEIYLPYCDKATFEETDVGVNQKVEARDRIRLLIVDDEPVIMEGFVGLFNLSDCEATGFTNGCEALKQFADSPHSYDVIVTDQVMPAMSGVELIREVKRIRPEIPVILCSGYSEHIQRKDSEFHQADAYRDKPTSFKDLLRLVNELCGKNASQD